MVPSSGQSWMRHIDEWIVLRLPSEMPWRKGRVLYSGPSRADALSIAQWWYDRYGVEPVITNYVEKQRRDDGNSNR